MSDIFDEFRERNQRELNKLSLEFLTNTHYKKHVAKHNPAEIQKKMEHHDKFIRNKARITTMIYQLLEEYEDLTTVSTLANMDIQHGFKKCVDKIIQYIEWNRYRENGDPEEGDDDENTLFASIEEPVEPVPLNRRNQQKIDAFMNIATATIPSISNEKSTLWGRKITKSDSNAKVSSSEYNDKDYEDSPREEDDDYEDYP